MLEPRSCFRSTKAFSLIELIVSISIIVILVGMAVGYYSEHLYNTQVSKAKADLDGIKSAITSWDSNYPTDIFKNFNYQSAAYTNELDGGAAGNWGNYSMTLNSLLGKYLNNLPVDPWGNAYNLNTQAGYIASYGSDGVQDSASDSGPRRTGTTGDLIVYYLPFELTLTAVKIREIGVADNTVAAGDYVEYYFSKDIRIRQFGGAAGDSLGTYCSFATDFSFTSGVNAFNNAVYLRRNGTLANPERYYNQPRVGVYVTNATDVTTNGFRQGRWVRVNSANLNYFRDFDPYYTNSVVVGALGKGLANNNPVQAVLRQDAGN
ncbi:MAG: prepilin-type N-terminal cleavage/methylation domain-containing protein [candidate division Zixibacteria bacterium]|nr:prepilin-type N-terminal cleavage/methylation domain-containing protein [candidate division Zixibacteria bacterium]